MTMPITLSNASHLYQDWQRLRARWEYSHAVGALLQLLVTASLILAALRRAR